MTSSSLQALWLGSDCFKSFHDPAAGLVEVVSNRPASGGHSITLGEGLILSLDEDEQVVHLSLNEDSCVDEPRAPLERPADGREATFAEAEVEPDHPVTCSFDAVRGELRVRFTDRSPDEWGRIGSNLIWLALDNEQRLAGIVVEGVSHDPGGAAQLKWLQEAGGE